MSERGKFVRYHDFAWHHHALPYRNEVRTICVDDVSPCVGVQDDADDESGDGDSCRAHYISNLKTISGYERCENIYPYRDEEDE